MVFIKEGTICDMHESLYNNNYNNKTTNTIHYWTHTTV